MRPRLLLGSSPRPSDSTPSYSWSRAPQAPPVLPPPILGLRPLLEAPYLSFSSLAVSRRLLPQLLPSDPASQLSAWVPPPLPQALPFPAGPAILHANTRGIPGVWLGGVRITCLPPAHCSHSWVFPSHAGRLFIPSCPWKSLAKFLNPVLLPRHTC